MGYYDPLITESKNKNVRLGRKIYMAALSGRRGFRDDQLGIEDAEIWKEIFTELGKLARAAVELEQGK